jgi:hypothetical protein
MLSFHLDACGSGFPVSTRLPKTIAPLSSFNSTPGYAGQAGVAKRVRTQLTGEVDLSVPDWT